MNPLNKLKDTLSFRITLMGFAILLIIFREPKLFLYPRMWAEEGCIFYAFALHHSLYDIFITAHVGYLTLFNSIISSIQAKLFSVENAAIVSTYAGFLVQLIPIYIITFTTHKFWNNPLKKIIYVFTIIIVMAPELWLNTTNSHFIFGLITFLIMTIQVADLTQLQTYLFRLLLFIGGLTGPASVLFTPMFLLRAYKEKTREKYIQATIIAFCSLIQAIIIIHSLLYNNKYQRLSTHNNKRTIYHFFMDNFSTLPHTSTSYLHQTIFFFGLSYGILMAILFIYLLIKNRKDNIYLTSLVSLLIIGSFSTLGSLNMAGAPRYAYIPTCIFIIIIISETFKLNIYQSKIKYAAPIVLTICLFTNTIYYKYGMRNVYSDSYPKWSYEVAKWRIDSTYAPMVHPGKDPGQCVKL